MNKRIATTSILLAALATSVSVANETPLEEITVTAEHTKRVFFLEDELSVAPDTAQLLKKVPGGNVNGNGPLTGIPQYRGMYGPRVGVSINGAVIAPAGPNWMDPPLSYAAPSQMVKLEVYRGIAPVSVVQESIGGAIVSETKYGDFTSDQQWSATGRASISGQSAYDGTLVNGMAAFANDSHHFSIAAMTEEGDDAEFSGGRILPSSYERDRLEVFYGFRTGQHQISMAYTRNETGNAGTPSLPMDIDYFDGDLLRLNYEYQGAHWDVSSQLHASELVHGMTNFHLRPAPMSAAMWRQNTTDVDNYGFSLKGQRDDTQGHWLLGLDYFDESHNGLIDNPNNPMFFVEGFNEASRSVMGAFIEREQRLNDQLIAEIALRINQVESDAGQVDGTPARMMPPARQLRDSFNTANRKVDDTNVDAVAKFWFKQSADLSYYAGIARKTRSASFVERYLWLPLQATGGLADGFTYTGNLALKPEHSNEVEVGIDLANESFSVSPRIFYKEVSDFIQGTPTQDQSAAMFVRMMNMSRGSNNPAPLQFNNVDARLYGFDVDWQYRLDEQWSLSGLLNYVRGERDDINDNLYRIAPSNASVQLSYEAGKLNANLEVVAYSDQNKVSRTNGELATEGYELVNVSGAYEFNDRIKVIVGASNLLDKEYVDHLAGYNRVRNPEIAMGSRLPGVGRNLYLRFDFTW